MDERYMLERAAKMVAERQERLGEVQERVRNVRGRAESEDGRIAVEVSSMGALESLELDPRAMRMASEDLAAMIVELSRKAAQNASEQTQDAMNVLLGGDIDWQEMVNQSASFDLGTVNRILRNLGAGPVEMPEPPSFRKRQSDGG